MTILVQVPYEPLLPGNRMIIELPAGPEEKEGTTVPYEITVPGTVVPGTILPVQVPTLNMRRRTKTTTGRGITETQPPQPHYRGKKNSTTKKRQSSSSSLEARIKTNRNHAPVDGNNDDDDDNSNDANNQDTSHTTYRRTVVPKQHAKQRAKRIITTKTSTTTKKKTKKTRKRKLRCDDPDWMQMFHLLVKYQQHKGTTRVPRSYIDPDTKLRLGYWVHHQAELGVDRMTEEKHRILTTIQFNWDDQPITVTPITDWMTMYQRLLDYYHQYKTTTTITHGGDNQLRGWVTRLRHQKETLTATQLTLLEEVQFVFGSAKERRFADWRAQYHTLRQYMNDHHDDEALSGVDLKLYTWIGYQRQRKKKGKLSPHEIDLLNKLNFVWVLKEEHCDGHTKLSNRTLKTDTV